MRGGWPSCSSWSPWPPGWWGAPPTTPTTPPASGGGGRDLGVQVQERAFEAGGGSGIVARALPGVLWAIRTGAARTGRASPRTPCTPTR